jgi:hypothetical protein
VVAQKVQVLLVCDLHDDETEGTETVSFALDGSSYEIDLCEEHAGELREDLASYVGAARRAGRTSGGGPRKPGSSKAAAKGASNVSQVREWARANGFEVSERGRISSEVLEVYAAAQK